VGGRKDTALCACVARQKLSYCVRAEMFAIAIQAGYTALHTACHFGHTDVVEYLIQRGAPIEAVTKVNDPLQDASFCHLHQRWVIILKDAGTDDGTGLVQQSCPVVVLYTESWPAKMPDCRKITSPLAVTYKLCRKTFFVIEFNSTVDVF